MSAVEVAASLSLGTFQLDAAFTAPAKGVTCLFGPSGSGKTTVLRCIAGLEPCVRGAIRVGGAVWMDSEQDVFVPVHRRSIGYVFQDANLFPHLTVRRNIEYGYRRLPVSGQRISFDDAVGWLGLQHLLERRPAGLSGGERQRTAIARALVTSPSILLMDEPVSALDEPGKQEILAYIERLHETLPIPILYVSHARAEVTRLADFLVTLENGRVTRAASADDLFAESGGSVLGTHDVASVLECEVAEHDTAHHLTCVTSALGPIWLLRLERNIGDRVRVQIPARDVSLALQRETGSSILNQFDMIVETVGPYNPGQVLVQLRSRKLQIAARLSAIITERSKDSLAIRPGQSLCARIKGINVAR